MFRTDAAKVPQVDSHSSVFSLSSGSHVASHCSLNNWHRARLGYQDYFSSSQGDCSVLKVCQGAMVKVKGLAWTLFDNAISASHASPSLKTPQRDQELRERQNEKNACVHRHVFFFSQRQGLMQPRLALNLLCS